MSTGLKATCLSAVGLATAWGASAALANTVQIGASMTPSQNFTNAAFIYASNSSADFPNNAVELGFDIVPLGNLSSGTPVNFGFNAEDDGGRPEFPGDSSAYFEYILAGQNAAGGVSILSSFVVGGNPWTSDYGSLNESDIFDALADPNNPTSIANLRLLYDDTPRTFRAFGSPGVPVVQPLNVANYSPNESLPSTAGVPFDFTTTEVAVVPLPAAAMMGGALISAVTAAGALQRRRRATQFAGDPAL